MKFLSILLILSGCAWQSAPLEIGNGKFETSANASPARGGVSGAREMALNNANDKCKSLGKLISDVEVRTETTFPANGNAVVIFSCK